MGNLKKYNCKLLVVGNGKKGQYIKLANKLKCTENVIFAGMQNNIEQLLGASDICLQPTFYDPASLVVLESLASGVPVITTKHNGMGEIITNGREGFVINEPCDILELTKSVEYLIDKENLKNSIFAARQLAEKYSLINNYKEIMNVYNKI